MDTSHHSRKGGNQLKKIFLLVAALFSPVLVHGQGTLPYLFNTPVSCTTTTTTVSCSGTIQLELNKSNVGYFTVKNNVLTWGGGVHLSQTQVSPSTKVCYNSSCSVFGYNIVGTGFTGTLVFNIESGVVKNGGILVTPNVKPLLDPGSGNWCFRYAVEFGYGPEGLTWYFGQAWYDCATHYAEGFVIWFSII